MGSLLTNTENLVRKVPGGRWLEDNIFGKPGGGRRFYGEAPIPLGSPSTDTAANLQTQQDQLRNRQRGVMSNIFAGNSGPAPSTGSNTLLGG